MVQFVIWGIGNRGKIAAEFIGYQYIKAFVDSNEMLQGIKYKGLPIIDIEQYMDRYRNCLLLVSPYEDAEIVNILKKKGIESYLLFSECPSEIYSGQLKSIDEIKFPDVDYSKIVILGISLFSIMLHEYFLKKGINIPLLMQEGDADIRALVNDCVYYEKEYSYAPDNLVIQSKKKAVEDKEVSVLDFYRLAGYVEKFCNPKLRRFKDLYLGKRCFVVGNGSSLTELDLNKLSKHKEICFGMNGIPIIFKKTLWRPDYYVCEDDKAMDLFGDSVLRSGISNIMISDAGIGFLKKAKEYDNIDVFHMTIEDYLPDRPSFSDDIEKVLYCGYTVAYVCLQIAVYMGFREIYLLGIDFDYEDGDTVEVKHFSQEYHKDKNKINPCRRSENLLAYQAALQYADSHGVKIYNATRGGKLEVFERVDFDNLV